MGMADNVFATVQGNRQKIADNYLSLKAYAQAAADSIADYVTKGKGKGLSSIGDLLESLSQTAGEAEPPAAEVDGSVSKVNGLVNEYLETLGEVKDRWPMGLGHYLLAKLEVSMQGAGALEVDKIAGKAGNFVFINAHSVGLSSKLPDFEGLAVNMRVYEETLAGLTGTVSNAKIAGKPDLIKVPPPEWQGN